MDKILVTGGCGFVGSSLALRLKAGYPGATIICLDNLRRRGSELNIPRLKAAGVEFQQGDIRCREDLSEVGGADLVLECSAEPSVMAGYGASPEYVLNTNLVGTLNCLEFARHSGAGFIFLSTSRVYPFKKINGLIFQETESRFELLDGQSVAGASRRGISEHFPLDGPRSLYGATKLASELIIQEYADMYDMPSVINRCGVLTGAWQFGKVDQGVIVLWAARHFWRKKLAYFGYGGEGKQVRDILHVDDLYRLIDMQISALARYTGEIFNVGGGPETSISLRELTALCQQHTGNIIDMDKVAEDRVADIRLYVTDNTRITELSGWKPQISADGIVAEVCAWIEENQTVLEGVLG